jgi:hypothetical protein
MRRLLFCIAISVSSGGCLLGTALDAIDDLDTASDCNTICNRYQDCVQEHRSLTDCVESCERSSRKDDRFMERVDDCASCIDANACDITTKCEDECAGVMP